MDSDESFENDYDFLLENPFNQQNALAPAQGATVNFNDYLKMSISPQK